MQLTHRNIWLNATTFGWHLGVSDRDVYLHTLPQFHCNGWGMLYAVTGMGGQHIVLRKVDGAEILRRVERARRDADVRRAGRRQHGPRRRRRRGTGRSPGRDRVRIVVAGAPPPTRTIERVETELGWEFVQIYGLTETSPLLTINRTPRRVRRPLARRPGGQAQPRRRAGHRLPRSRVDDEGEVLARSNVVMEGYWQQPDATDAAIVDGWFHTGDGGSIDEDNYVTISDRKKDVIISGGENVSSIEVEDAIFQHPDVTEVAVIGIPDEKWGELVTALVVKAEGSDAHRRRRHRLDQAEARRLQVPQAGRVPRRPRPHGHRQAPEVQAARPVLGGPGAPGQLSRPPIWAGSSPRPIWAGIVPAGGDDPAQMVGPT